MVFLAPINVFVFSILSRMRRKVLKYSDLRVKMMNEILAGIRIIKFYAWERPFAKEVARLRAKELRGLNWLAYVSAIGFSLILLSAPIIQPILVFVVYVSVQDKPLDPATAFTTVALFNILRFPFAFLPMGLLQYIQSKVSLRRLERYLAMPELTEYVMDSAPPDVDPTSPSAQVGSITIVNGTFSWVDPDAEPVKSVNEEEEQRSKQRKAKRQSKIDKKAEKNDTSMKQSIHSTVSGATEEGSKAAPITLQNITLTIQPGQLVAVVGMVGSGKSSLLSAMLGEMETIDNSKVYMPKPDNFDKKDAFLSYCAQTPWIVNDTLRDNILFGRDYNQERYEQVLEACALPDDLRVLPAGDKTEIGERGINLSGGQKARVSLARALYDANAKIVLLDDPLSAVDAHVGEHLFANAISGDVSRGMTRVLVTHHVHFLSQCDSVIVMDHGRIVHQGSYEELVAQGVDFAGAVDVSKHEKVKGEGDETESETASTSGKEKKVSKKKDGNSSKTTGGLLKDEEKMDGSVAGSAYSHYAKAGGLWNVFWILLVQSLGSAAEVTSQFWLAKWADAAAVASYSGHPMTKGKTNFYVGIYGLLGFLGILGSTVRSILMANQRLNASKKLHNDLAESVLHAPISFFDVTPVGRILNRFSADMDKVDLQLTQGLSQAITTTYSVLGAVAGIIASTKGTFLVPLVPLGYLVYTVQKWYRKTSTELQRLNSIANSPIFADFSQTLSGTSTIRAYGEEQRFFDHCKASFDNMNSSYVQLQLISNWLGLRLDTLGGVIGAFVAGVAVAASGFIPAGWLGLALSYSIGITGYLKFGVRMMATVEADLTSVERILFYTYNIPKEAPDTIPEADPDPNQWPSKGEIEFSNASMRYRDGPLVLKEISFTVKPGEKVGVVGRTGSGKSSLMVALFRITEIEGGSVFIDQVDAAKIGTTTLRLKLSIIPQDPVIFSNTVRYNLDPFETCSDEDIWEVLGKVNMTEVIAALPNGLSELVSEGGENFSQGQRQLICIARSLLRKPKILVLDEATASIDK
jgi:ABC-type multidrug transport system fused ATPase/permease subunit